MTLTKCIVQHIIKWLPSLLRDLSSSNNQSGIDISFLFLINLHLIFPSFLEVQLLVLDFSMFSLLLLLQADVVRVNDDVFKCTFHLNQLFRIQFLRLKSMFDVKQAYLNLIEDQIFVDRSFFFYTVSFLFFIFGFRAETCCVVVASLAVIVLLHLILNLHIL